MECKKFDSNRILGMTVHFSMKIMQVEMNKIGLYKGQHFLLEILWEEKEMSQKELAEKMNISQPTVNRMISRMEKTGMIKRSKDPRDSRSTLISLTDLGEEKHSLAESLLENHIYEFSKDFTDEESYLLKKLMLKQLFNMRKYYGHITNSGEEEKMLEKNKYIEYLGNIEEEYDEKINRTI